MEVRVDATTEIKSVSQDTMRSKRVVGINQANGQRRQEEEQQEEQVDDDDDDENEKALMGGVVVALNTHANQRDHPFVCLSICLSVCLSVCLCLFACPCVHLLSFGFVRARTRQTQDEEDEVC